MEDQFDIVYGIRPFSDAIHFIIPEAYIVRIEKNKLSYSEKIAKPEIIESYDLSYHETDHEILLKIIQELSIEGIEAHFNKDQKKPQTFSQLFLDEKVKKYLKKKIEDRMVKFYKIIQKNNYHLCYNIERKVYLEHRKLTFSATELTPILNFNKTTLGIKYTLYLQHDKEQLRPYSVQPIIILDKPAMVIIANKIYSIAQINGNKIRPFLKNEEIFIANRLIKNYFESFLLDTISKVDVNVEGFDIEYDINEPKVRISFTRDFITNQYVMQLHFHYDKIVFGYADAATKRVRMKIDDLGNITVYYTQRNADFEEKIVKQYLEKGLQLNGSKRLFLPDKSDEYAIMHWIVNKANTDHTVDPPEIDNGTIEICPYNIRLSTGVSEDRDWFDIKAMVQVGGLTIPFKHVIKNIKEGNRLYQISPGKFFVLPIEWFSQFDSLAKFGHEHEDSIRIKKSNYQIVEKLDDKSKFIVNKLISVDEKIDFTISPLLKAELRPYQYEGAKWLVMHQINGLGACLADDMGLGKTVQTLAALVHKKEELLKLKKPKTKGQLSLFEENFTSDIAPLKALITLPASLVYNWENEIKKFTPSLHLCIYVGNTRKKTAKTLHTFDIILTTYQTLQRDIKILELIDFNYLVMDESHYLKNRASQIFGAMSKIKAENKISLSGTPIENSLADLWSQMQIINPSILGDFNFFKQNYIVPITRNSDKHVLADLKNMVDPFILRRTKKEVLEDLPDVIEHVQYCEMDEYHLSIYESEKSSIRNFLLDLNAEDPSYKFHVFASLMKLRQIANHPILVEEKYIHGSSKFDEVLEQLDTLIKAGSKVLVFSSFIKHLELFFTHFLDNKIKYALLTGEMSAQTRQKNVDLFMNDEGCDIFLLSIKAGGAGLNLVKADYVFILDPWWNPFVEMQAQARAHRIGQLKNVNVVQFIMKNTLEEKILALQKEKKKLADDILGNLEEDDLSTKEMLSLLE